MNDPKEHELKCWPPYFADICEWRKSFELRKADRDYRVGDTLWLREWDPTTESYTDSECVREIGYILLGDAETNEWGLAPGYCILGLKPYDNRAKHLPRITALEALLREAAEVLVPFAKEAASWTAPECTDEAEPHVCINAQYGIVPAEYTFGDLRRASVLHDKLKAEAPALEAKQ